CNYFSVLFNDNYILIVNIFRFLFFFFFFFFSSRRRHTRSLRDWSSDVCSSDLSTKKERIPARSSRECAPSLWIEATSPSSSPERSEERRVGKECRSRW